MSSGPSDKERTARALSLALAALRRAKDELSNAGSALGGVSPDLMDRTDYGRVRSITDSIFFLIDEVSQELSARLDLIDGYEAKLKKARWVKRC